MVRRLIPVLCAPLLALPAGCGESAPPSSPFPVDAPILSAADLAGDSLGYLAVLAAEDRRAPTQADLTTLLSNFDLAKANRVAEALLAEYVITPRRGKYGKRV